jgi:DNA-binding CsgD family transcriptional regulator
MTEISVLELTFHQRLARLLEQSGSSRLWPALASFLQDYVTFNSWTAMIFYHDRPPTLLADGGDDWDEFDDRLYSEYISGLYVLDPFYQFAMEQYSPGIYSLRDVSPDHFIDTEYYQKYFVHNVVGDEIQFLTMLPHGGTLSLSITTRAKFTAKEIGSMNLFSPWLLALMRRTAISIDVAKTTAMSAARHQPLDQWLRTRAAPPLTDREVQTTLLILAGHSVKAIAGKMGISGETVKTHKRHLYRKFGVSSPSALFALYLEVDT